MIGDLREGLTIMPDGRRPRIPAATALLMAGMLLAASGAASQAASPPATPATAPGPTHAQPVRFFFVVDVHSRNAALDRVIADAMEHRPDLILDGGDFVHDGTASEYRAAMAARSRVAIPWRIALGNHDAELRGPFPVPPPEIADFKSFDHGDVRFILLDNHEAVFTDEQLRRLEAELIAHHGRRIVVAMHVPPVLGDKPTAVGLRHLVPFPLASPSMRDPEQVEHFTGLMERHGVLAVLAGHTHFPYQETRNGVHYIVAGAAGGLTPGMGIANEYLDLTIEDREVIVRRVALGSPPGNPLSFTIRAFRFFAGINGFNHAEQGWNYTPSASVQLRGGIGQIESRAGDHTAFSAAASFERVLGEVGQRSWIADVGVTAGSHELITQLMGGYKLRPMGSFNENVFLSGAATANVGALRGSATAGLGARLGVGFEWRNLTGEVSRDWATNLRTTSLGFGHRY